MAQRVYINNNIANLKTFLETLVPDYFSSVTDSDGTIICKGTGQHTLFTVSKNNATWTFTACSEAGGTLSSSTFREIPYAYRCGSGVMLPISYYNGAIVIAKTNYDATAILLTTLDSNYAYCTNLICVAQNDALPAEQFSFPQQSIKSQTLLVPFPTNNVIGLPSFTKDVYFLMFTQFPPGQVWEMQIGGRKYLTNGYYAILDE